MNRLALYIDCSNLYYTVKENHSGQLNYASYLDYIKKYIGAPTLQKAFGAQRENEAAKFINALKQLGFETKWKKAIIYQGNESRPTCTADWDLGITCDIFRNINEFDTLILGSGDGDFAEVVALLTEWGKKVIVFASSPSAKLQKKATTVINITGDMVICK